MFLKTSTIATFPNSNNKSSKEGKSIPFAHKYRTAHFLGPSIKIGEVKLALLIQTCFLCEMICFRFLKISMLTVVYRGGSCLIYVICACLRIVVSNTYCAVFLFDFLRFVNTMLSVSLDCPSLIAPSGFSNVY